MSDVRDIFIAGLRDAHALELQAKDMMESVSRLEGYPEFRSRAADHAREIEVQIDRLRQCLEMAGESPSTLKGLGTRTVANLQGLMHSAVTDEVIKNALSGYAFEHFEIASYKSLIAFARHLGEEHMVPLLLESLREEEAMARWMDDHIEALTEQFCHNLGTAGAAAEA
jgi:ferritin-like metal-binding protein YciE